MVLTLICAVAATISLLNILDIWYMRHSNTHDRSIKGGIQLIQLFAVLVAIILIASILMNKSPAMLLSGLGAVVAVLPAPSGGYEYTDPHTGKRVRVTSSEEKKLSDEAPGVSAASLADFILI